MPADEWHCIRCGFDLPQRAKQDHGDSLEVTQVATYKPVSPALSLGAIWDQQSEKRRSNTWRIFLTAYLAWFAVFAIVLRGAFSSVIDLGIVACVGLAPALLIAYVLNLAWSSWKTIVTYKASISDGLLAATTRIFRHLSWTRIFAGVLTSNLFFLTSCTGGMVLSRLTRDTVEGRTNIERGRALDTRMSIIAVIPNAENPDVRKIVQVQLGNLKQFKQDNHDYSFVPPLGKGELNDPSSFTRTEYSVTAAGDGRVLVETKFHDDEHHVVGRYEAIDKDIEPRYTKTSHDFAEFTVDFVFGIALSLVLGLIGYFFKWCSKLASTRSQ